MSTELDHVPSVVSPRTGEVLSAESPPEDLGRFIEDARVYKDELQEHINRVGRWLMIELDRRKKWTLTAGQFKLSAPSPKPGEEWDGAALREALLPLVDSGELAIEAVDAAVEQIVTFKVRKSGINALRSGGGAAEEIVNRLATPVEKARYVSVSRAA